MHPNAQEWDKNHGIDTSCHGRQQGHNSLPLNFIPHNRPCDWCGEDNPLGFIHPDCVEIEITTRKWIIE